MYWGGRNLDLAAQTIQGENPATSITYRSTGHKAATKWQATRRDLSKSATRLNSKCMPVNNFPRQTLRAKQADMQCIGAAGI